MSPTHMDVQQQRCNHQSSFRSKLDLQHQFYHGWTDHQPEDGAPTPPKPTKERTLPRSSVLDDKPSDTHAPPVQSRELPPIQSDDRSAVPQHVPQQASSPHSVPPPPLVTLPEPRPSRPVGVKDLLNPTSGDKTNASGRQHDGERTGSQWTVPMAATSGPTTTSLPLTSMRKESLGGVTLGSTSPTLMKTYPHPLPQSLTPASRTSYGPGLVTTGLSTATIDARQSPFVFPRDQAPASVGSGPLLSMQTTMAPSIPPAAHASLPPPRHASPPSALPQDASTNEPRSFFSAPFAFGEKGSHAPILGAPGQCQYQLMKMETEQGPIQVSVDVQTGSEAAKEKRSRNAVASHKFRRRRKAKDKETSNTISNLEAQIREMTEKKEYYQQERDFLQGIVQQSGIPIPPRAPSPRQRHASEYVPPQWQPPHTVEAAPPMPPLKRMTTIPSEHIEVLRQTARPQGLFHPNANPFDVTAPR